MLVTFVGSTYRKLAKRARRNAKGKAQADRQIHLLIARELERLATADRNAGHSWRRASRYFQSRS